MLEERIQSYQLKDVTSTSNIGIKSSHLSLIEPTTPAAETENTYVDGRKISDILIIAIKLWRENEEPIIEKFQFDLKVIQILHVISRREQNCSCKSFCFNMKNLDSPHLLHMLR